MKAPLVESLGLELRGVEPRRRTAGLAVLACEMKWLQRELGYESGGYHAFRNDPDFADRPIWPEYCLRETGLTEASIRFHFESAQAIRRRIGMVVFRPGMKELLELIETRPSELSKDQRTKLIDGIVNSVIFPKEGASILRRELKEAEARNRGARPTIDMIQRDMTTVGRLMQIDERTTRRVVAMTARRIACDPEYRSKFLLPVPPATDSES